jgi:two-component system sensor histidine kinase BaeS
MRFVSDAANRRFIESLRRSLWVGLGLSLAIAAAFGLLFSRSLSAPAVRLAGALDSISRGDLSSRVAEGGAREIALIGASANRLRRQLQREQDLRRQWVQDIAHDLRTPVAALRAQFEGMRDGVLETTSERLDIVLREIGRVQEMVADLEELMRLESPEMRLSLRDVPAQALVEEARERFEYALAGKKIRFQARVEQESFRADPVLIQRALSNFLANAVRHCPEGGRVTVAVQAVIGAVSLSVANSGEPIPEGDLERVFDRLFRGEPARSSPGSGLGLTIARRIAELHGGEVRIANREDGVLVELRLPPAGPVL